ncbi:MAG: hypothetical protein MRY78_09275 [Saprospiraceae bacterium]|nr:hypothetical protein [Saprospiraceae bacterium]
MKKLYTYTVLLFLLGGVLSSCFKDRNLTNDGEMALNNQILLPAGSFQLEESEVTLDDDLQVNNNGSAGGMRMEPGATMSTAISFNAANANVTHAGIRFGNSGGIWAVPIPEADGNASGTLIVPMQIPPEICNQISRICHDIKCYEFAIANDGSGEWNISRGNINDIILGCAACDEPSCQDLAPSCDCDINEWNAQGTSIFDNTFNITTEAEYCDWFNNVWRPWYEGFLECLPAFGVPEAEQEILRTQYESLLLSLSAPGWDC